MAKGSEIGRYSENSGKLDGNKADILKEYLSIWNKLLGNGRQCKDITLSL